MIPRQGWEVGLPSDAGRRATPFYSIKQAVERLTVGSEPKRTLSHPNRTMVKVGGLSCDDMLSCDEMLLHDDRSSCDDMSSHDDLSSCDDMLLNKDMSSCDDVTLHGEV